MDTKTRFATLLRPILICHNQKLKLSILSQQSIYYINNVLVSILICINNQYLLRKRPRPDLYLSRPILKSSNQKLGLSFLSRQSILNINKVLVLILIGINFQYLLRKRRRPDLTFSRQTLTCHNTKLGLTILSPLSIPNVNKVSVSILTSINCLNLLGKRLRPDLYLLRPILISCNQNVELSFVSRQSILNVNKVSVSILTSINC